ncbi:MAG: lamin tail domain-containing protein [Verrucomicrobiales bacterium]|nr:lamin tail domain-containing protein [Verrucomicrobiales bacterium]
MKTLLQRVPALMLAAVPSLLHGGPLTFSTASVTFQQGTPYQIQNTLNPNTEGWGVYGGLNAAQTAWFTLSAPANGTQFQISMLQNLGSSHWIQEFRLSVTTDSVPSAGGNWTVWNPAVRISAGTTLAVVNTDHIRSTGSALNAAYTLRGDFPMQGITGVRLECFPYDYNTSDALAASLGRSANGNFVLSEFKAEADPEINVAQGRPATASAALWSGFPATNIVDGSAGTITHPLASAGTLGFYYEVDLQATYSINRILVRNRNDGCCPERLSNYQIQLYGDDVDGLGDLNWSATIRGDGTNSGVGGVDTVTAAADATPGHVFAGRFLRLINLSNAAYNPQVAEIEVYGSQLPSILNFTVDDDTISSGGSAVLSWQTSNASSVSISPVVGTVAAGGTVTVSPPATTTYTLTASNAAGTVTATLAVGVDVVLQPPAINEFQASGSSLTDEDNTEQDWLELKNPNPYRLDVGGFKLTDGSPVPWVFAPGTVIPANGFLVVFASGKNRQNPSGRPHTDFSLSSGGEYLALLSPVGAILQEFVPAYPLQLSGFSYGPPSGGGPAGFLSPPTPGAVNGAVTYLGKVADTRFSVDRGFYSTPIDVAVTCDTPGAEIRYTLDGTKPTASTGTVYTAPVHITTTAVLRAAAFKPGWAPSSTDTHTYLYIASVLQQGAAPPGWPTTWLDGGTSYAADYQMDPDVVNSPTYAAEMPQAMQGIRTLSIVIPPADFLGSANGIYNNPQQRGAAWERAISAELLLPPDAQHPNGSTGFQENCGLRVWGYGWRAHSASKKHSFRLKFKDIYEGPGKLEYPLFPGWPVERFDNIVLRSQGSRGWNDFRTPDISQSQYIHDAFARDSAREMGKIDGPSTHVHLYVNGLYWGLYNAVLRPDASFGEEHFGGTEADYDALNARVGALEVIDGDRVAWDAALALANAGLDDSARYAQFQTLVDVDNLIDYILFQIYSTNHDSPSNQNNFRALRKREANGLYRFYFWDMEYTLWDQNENTLSSMATTGETVYRMFYQLRANAEFRLRFADHVQKHCFNNGALTPARSIARWQSRATELYSPILAESARWGDARREPPFTRNVEWEAERTRLTGTYFPQRTGIMLNHLRTASLFPAVAAPSFNQHGGSVNSGFSAAISAPAGTIYYSLDGTDPRTGGIPYSAAIPLTTPGHVLISTRANSGGVWSAMTVADFSVSLAAASTANLVLSEIHYNPVGGGTEFVELMNIGISWIDLGGCRFSEGITHTFPANSILAPGTRLVLQTGDFAGSLDNAGERITLLAPDSLTIIRTLRYDDKAPWPTEADGTGRSLVLVAPQTSPDHENPLNWRASVAVGGSPGASDAVPFSGNPAGDDDGDGWSNLLEYTLGPNPEIVWSHVAGAITVTSTRSPAADDAAVVLEFSSDLQTWHSGPGYTEQTGWNEWRSLSSPGNRAFVRLAVRLR